MEIVKAISEIIKTLRAGQWSDLLFLPRQGWHDAKKAVALSEETGLPWHVDYYPTSEGERRIILTTVQDPQKAARVVCLFNDNAEYKGCKMWKSFDPRTFAPRNGMQVAIFLPLAR